MLDIAVLFFMLGVIAGAVRSDLTLPKGLYDTLSIYLLLAIGLKGGIELAKQPLLVVLPQALAVASLGFILPLIAFPLLLKIGRLARVDAASIAAHYGSVSIGTYAVGTAFLDGRGISYEPYLPLFVVLLEMPAIAVGIILAKRGNSSPVPLPKLLHEIFLSKGMVLLGGGLVIGWLAGPAGAAKISPFFYEIFAGMLALFLIDMGLTVGHRMGVLRQTGAFLISFGLLFPMVASLAGATVGLLAGLSVGGAALVAVLAASASYIAVPAAMRIALPQADASLSITAALGVTFPFNVIVGIPLYLSWTQSLHALMH